MNDAVISKRKAAKYEPDADALASVILDSIRDPENQPSQYGTVPMEWHDAAMSLLRRALLYVGMVRLGDVSGDQRDVLGVIEEMEKFIARRGRPE